MATIAVCMAIWSRSYCWKADEGLVERVSDSDVSCICKGIKTWASETSSTE